MPKYLIDMPEGWKPQVCGTCSMDYACHANYSIKASCITRCPLANAKKAVEMFKGEYGSNDSMEALMSLDGKPVTLYAVEDGK